LGGEPGLPNIDPHAHDGANHYADAYLRADDPHAHDDANHYADAYLRRYPHRGPHPDRNRPAYTDQEPDRDWHIHANEDGHTTARRHTDTHQDTHGHSDGDQDSHPTPDLERQ
jgi:hypothetical protein